MAQARMKAQLQSQGGEADAPNPVAETNAAFGRLCLPGALALPIVTVLEGTVMGGGFGPACVSDVVMLDTAAFRLPETRWASSLRRSRPSWSSAWVTPRPSACR